MRYLNKTNVDLNSPHRKIKMHFGLIDNNTIDYDHGTHVSTSVAGYSTISDLYDYRGMAPNAKLALVQLGCQNPLGCTCDLVPGCACLTYPNATCPQKKGSIYQPTEPHKSIHYFTYELMKSRIQTNSWGGGTADCVEEKDEFTCQADLTDRGLLRGVTYHLQAHHYQCTNGAQYVSEVVKFVF